MDTSTAESGIAFVGQLESDKWKVGDVPLPAAAGSGLEHPFVKSVATMTPMCMPILHHHEHSILNGKALSTLYGSVFLG